MAGISPVAVLRTDPIERQLLLEVAARTVRMADDRDEALARRIIRVLAEALKRGR
jgi:hypothetical protein